MGRRNQENPPVQKETRPLAREHPSPGGRSVAAEPPASPGTVWDDGELAGTPRGQETTRPLPQLANVQKVDFPLNASESSEGGSMARRRGFVPHPGVSKRSGKQPQTTIMDADFDRSKFDFVGAGEIGAVKGKPWQRRLFDPALPTHGDRLNRPDSTPHESPQNKCNQSGWRGKITGRNVSGPRPMAHGSREGGKIMILNNPAASQRLSRYGSHEPEESPQMFAGPETRPISLEQLIAEVKGIYSGLVMVEAKCCEVDAKQAIAAKDRDGKYPRLNNEQWQALNSLHRTLLHEHHDFFLASQHPIASPALRRLAVTYSMPTRMWRHGIQSYLELLRHRLPHSMEHMLTFLYLAYNILTLLYETVPAFKDTWIESLGDLGRYRMAIEDDDVHDREVWAKTARFWYSKAADKTPDVGRLYHHLAILARPNVLFQLFYYCKSLGVTQPFPPSQETVLTVFDSVLTPDNLAPTAPLVVVEFVKLHGINFTHTGSEKFDNCLAKFLNILSTHLSDPMSKWKGPGCYVAVCNITGLYQYGEKDSLLHQASSQGAHVVDVEMEDVPALDESGGILPPLPTKACAEKVASPPFRPISGTSGDQSARGLAARERSLNNSKKLAYDILNLALQRIGDVNVLPHVHIWLVFMMRITTSKSATRLLENTFPWESLVPMLNFLLKSFDSDKFEGEKFPVSEHSIGRPLPEDFIIHGLDWSRLYYPDGWFENAHVEDGERSMELPSMANVRIERILWLATRIAASGDHLVFKNRRFFIHPSLYQRMQQPMSEQSKEVRFLNQQHQPKSQIKTEPAKTTMTDKGSEALQPRYTVLVIDTNLLLNHLETFRLIISTNDWRVIIPRCVVDELLSLTSNPGNEGNAAKAAIIAINDAVNEKKDVTVVAANGNIAMNIGFENLRKNAMDESSKINDIIQTTIHQGVVRRGMLGNAGETEAAVLITEDVSMRAKAYERGVTAMATSIVHRYLSPPDACARIKRKSFEHPVMILKQRYPQWEEEDIECALSESDGDLHGAIEQMKIGGGKKRQRKRGINP